MNLYPWLQENIKEWHKMVVATQTPHALLLAGAKGIGKFALAKQMAHLAMCENLSVSGVCHQCSACELLKVGNHTDLSIVAAEKSIIKVDQIRKLTRDVILTSARNQHKVIIIHNAEQMNKSAANALLKTLEEPPKKVIIILITSEIGKLLPTIKSRCIKINIATPSYPLARDWLSTNTNASTEEIDLSLMLVNTAPLTAKSLLEAETIKHVKVMLTDLAQLSIAKKNVLEISKEWNKNQWFKHLSYLAAYFFNQLRIDQNNQEYTLFNLQHHITIDSNILPFIKSIHKFMHYLDTPLKVELLLEDLLIEWQKLSKH